MEETKDDLRIDIGINFKHETIVMFFNEKVSKVTFGVDECERIIAALNNALIMLQEGSDESGKEETKN